MKTLPPEWELVHQQASEFIESNRDSLLNSPSTLQIINSICSNIISHPNEEKFRKIRLANPKFNEFVMNVPGAINLLFLCGFEIDDQNEYLIIKPGNLNMNDLQALVHVIQDYITIKSSTSTTKSNTLHPSQPTSSSCCSTDQEMEERRRKLLEEKKKIQAEKDKIKQQLNADKEERKYLPSGVSSKKTKKPESNSKKTFKDIGVDLSSQGGG
ncbi:hypothetical protein C9374_003556 [Naegleria lovaniensis]|uniref:PUB domain-containing protein n=1 Tax=Naegleria lovaniensis TaxID=51637 RepID=A0AA88H7N6_NAELO|nr:uncharacterized protein C9374_003556 [Naegleria lovaniensis]KAG2393792.1 hypothetical protein C9374_003556 [Naegleria lovaniensis]